MSSESEENLSHQSFKNSSLNNLDFLETFILTTSLKFENCEIVQNITDEAGLKNLNSLVSINNPELLFTDEAFAKMTNLKLFKSSGKNIGVKQSEQNF